MTGLSASEAFSTGIYERIKFAITISEPGKSFAAATGYRPEELIDELSWETKRGSDAYPARSAVINGATGVLLKDEHLLRVAVNAYASGDARFYAAYQMGGQEVSSVNVRFLDANNFTDLYPQLQA